MSALCKAFSQSALLYSHISQNQQKELFSCHHLRHTFCTRFCENETNLKVIQEIMGHADITTTMDIYNEATKDKKMESFAGLEGKIKIR